MQPNTIFGVMGLVLVVALAATAFKPDSAASKVLDSATNGFANVVRAATLQPAG